MGHIRKATAMERQRRHPGAPEKVRDVSLGK
jgi:hypothetical protein